MKNIQLSEKFTTKFDVETLASLKAKAKVEGVPPSRLVRKFVTSGLSEKTKKDVSFLENDLVELKRSLSPIGGNLNQIALFFNLNGTIDSDHLSQLSAEVDAIRQAHKKIIATLIKIKAEVSE